MANLRYIHLKPTKKYWISSMSPWTWIKLYQLTTLCFPFTLGNLPRGEAKVNSAPLAGYFFNNLGKLKYVTQFSNLTYAMFGMISTTSITPLPPSLIFNRGQALLETARFHSLGWIYIYILIIGEWFENKDHLSQYLVAKTVVTYSKFGCESTNHQSSSAPLETGQVSGSYGGTVSV